MNIINIIIIILILYVCYKIVIFNETDTKETFQSTPTEKINLEGKDIFLGRNLFVGVSQNEVDSYNKLKNTDGTNVLDLSKNNMIIKNNPDFKIKKNICFDNFCINKKQIELIGGEVDAPHFMKNDKNVYYNHDSDTKFNDLPDKMCFKNKDEETNEVKLTCLDYNDFEILNGERGIKLKSSKTPNYVINNNSFMELVSLDKKYYDKNKKKFSDVNKINEYVEFLKNLESYVANLQKYRDGLRRLNQNKSQLECSINQPTLSTISTEQQEIEVSNILCDLIEEMDNIILEVTKKDLSGRSNEEFVRDILSGLLYIGYKSSFFYNSNDKIKEKINTLNRKGDTRSARRKVEELYGIINDFASNTQIPLPTSTPTPTPTPTSTNLERDDFKIKNGLAKNMFILFRENVEIDQGENGLRNQFLMPYYIDFRKRGSGIPNVKDQLFFKENYNCAENNSFYSRNPDFDPLKYPYLRGFDYSEKCIDIPKDSKGKQEFCNNNPEGRFCYNTCCPEEGEEGDKADWCPSEGNGEYPIYDFYSNQINTDEYPIDIKRSKLDNYEPDSGGIPLGPLNRGRDDSRKHGYFKVDPQYIDTNYQGYYVDKNNNNTRFNAKKNLFTELSNFFGIDTNHRASHNGVCGKYGSITKTKNFCAGKNAYDPEYEDECNKVSKYRKALYDKIDQAEQAIEEQKENTGLVQNEITDIATDAEPTETDAVQTTQSLIEELDNLPELNFYIQPAKGSDGNILTPNTYFHAHNHIH